MIVWFSNNLQIFVVKCLYLNYITAYQLKFEKVKSVILKTRLK